MGIKSIALVAATLVLSTSVNASSVYLSSLNGGVNGFSRYDTNTNIWTQLNDYHTGSNFAIDTSGNMYSYSGDRTAINKYDTVNDVWNYYMSAPTINSSYASSQYNFYNLEITNSGRFLLTGGGTDTNVWYSDGGAWSSQALGFVTNATGDYDPTTGQYAITGLYGTSPSLIDANTLAVTNFSGIGSGSDWRRSGTILDGSYYIQTGTNAIERWDLSNPGANPTLITNPGNALNWMASAADRDNSLLYAVDIVDNDFYVYDGVSWTALANTLTGGNHTTLAYVSDISAVPIPAAVWLFGSGLIGLIGVARRKKP